MRAPSPTQAVRRWPRTRGPVHVLQRAALPGGMPAIKRLLLRWHSRRMLGSDGLLQRRRLRRSSRVLTVECRGEAVRAFRLSVPVTIFAAGCGGQPSTPAATATDASVDHYVADAGRDAASGVDAPGGDTFLPPPRDSGPPLPDATDPLDARIVEASGSCAPSAPQFPPGAAQCCAGTIPCIGNCIVLPSGQVGCDCFGIAGGCWPDNQPTSSMCCGALSGCAPVSYCFGGH